MLSDAKFTVDVRIGSVCHASLTKRHNFWDRDRAATHVTLSQGDAVQAVPKAQCLQPVVPYSSSQERGACRSCISLVCICRKAQQASPGTAPEASTPDSTGRGTSCRVTPTLKGPCCRTLIRGFSCEASSCMRTPGVLSTWGCNTRRSAVPCMLGD